MQLVILHGPPAVGKLTVARELAEWTGFRLFHNHLTVDLLGAVFEFGTKAFVDLRESIWLAVLEGAAQERVPGVIFTFNPEATVRPEFIDELAVRMSMLDVSVHYVALTSPEAVIEARVEDAARAAFGKLRSLEQYRELKAGGAFAYPPLPDSGLTLDTSTMTPRDAAAAIVEHFRFARA